MSKITRNNYEEFFIDYFDGNLDNHQVAELMLFLAQNNDLDKEFNKFEFVELKEKKISFDFKKSLKKQDNTITGNVFADKCIDKIENNLNEEQIISFNNEIRFNIPKKNELEKYKQTIIKPNLSIKYSEKDKLKKSTFKVAKFKRVYQYAAILIAIILSYTLIENNTEFKQISGKTESKQIASIVNYGELSSFDKYDNQQAFTVIKRETPKIVAKSNSKIKIKKSIIEPIYINKLNAKLIVVEENLASNNIPEYRDNITNLYTPEITTSKQILEDELLNKSISNESEKKCNPTMIKALTNEIKSDVYISEMMTHYKKNNNDITQSKIGDTKTVWKILGEKFSVITGAKVEKVYNENGEVSRLAINSSRFRVSKKIRK